MKHERPPHLVERQPEDSFADAEPFRITPRPGARNEHGEFEAVPGAPVEFRAAWIGGPMAEVVETSAGGRPQERTTILITDEAAIRAAIGILDENTDRPALTWRGRQ